MVAIKKKKKKNYKKKKPLVRTDFVSLIISEILAFLYTCHANHSILHGWFPGSVSFPSNPTHALLCVDGQGMAVGEPRGSPPRSCSEPSRRKSKDPPPQTIWDGFRSRSEFQLPQQNPASNSQVIPFILVFLRPPWPSGSIPRQCIASR